MKGQNVKRKKIKTFLRNYLGGKCIKCNSKKMLQFDHVDRTTKKFEISQKLLMNINKLLLEVKKCQLLCRRCHAKKSVLERGDKMAKHGTLGMYNNHSCRCIKCKESHYIYWRKYHGRTNINFLFKKYYE